MKIFATTLLLICFMYSGFSQNLQFEVKGTYTKSITKDQLAQAMSMTDINPGYPSSWITDYVSTKVTATNNGTEMSAYGTNESLTEHQRHIIQQADMATDIKVEVAYRNKNAVTNEVSINAMHFGMTVVPEKQAEYIGGPEQLNHYLKINAIQKIDAKKSADLGDVIIRFTVTEEGEIANAQLSGTSKDPAIDKMLLKAINKMPKWKPAENAAGEKIAQQFVFSVGNIGC